MEFLGFPAAAAMLLMAVLAVTTFLRAQWERDSVPRLRDVLRQIQGAHGDIELAIDGQWQSLVATKGWLHFIPETGRDVASIALTDIASVEVTETGSGAIELRCTLEDGSHSPDFVTDNISRFAALFNVLVEYGREIRYQTH